MSKDVIPPEETLLLGHIVQAREIARSHRWDELDNQLWAFMRFAVMRFEERRKRAKHDHVQTPRGSA